MPDDRREPSFRRTRAELGTLVFLVSLGVLFVASLLGYALTRAANDEWRPAGAPGLPPGLALSTGLIAVLTLTLHRSLVAARKNHYLALERLLAASFVIAVAFLVAQAANWAALAHTVVPLGLYGFSFYFLTGLHAAHVLGGLIPLALTTQHARRREYSSSRHQGLTLCVWYWDFLAVVWIVLLVALVVG